MSERVHRYICEICGVDAITSENFKYIKEMLYNILPDEIAEGAGVSISVASRFRHLIRSPTLLQQKILYLLYELGKKERLISKEKLKSAIGTELNRVQFYYILAFLKLLEPPPIKVIYNYVGRRRKIDKIEVYPFLMEKYWPNIQDFNSSYQYTPMSLRKRGKKRARHGERIKQAWNILGFPPIDELDKLSEEEIQHLIEKVKNLSVIDFKLNGIKDISSQTVGSVKRYLQKLLTQKKKKAAKLPI